MIDMGRSVNLKRNICNRALKVNKGIEIRPGYVSVIVVRPPSAGFEFPAMTVNAAAIEKWGAWAF